VERVGASSIRIAEKFSVIILVLRSLRLLGLYFNFIR
jgi:hypothetical protein